MNSIWKERPSPDEYAPYHQPYIENVGTGNVIDGLESQRDEVYDFIHSLDERQAKHRYETGKWTVKQVLVHLIDNERIYAYRALSIARNSPEELIGYDQEEYADAASRTDRTLDNIAEEYTCLRTSNIHMFTGFSVDETKRKGVADGCTLSVRAIPFILAGHERHHLGVIERRYGLPLPS